MDQKGFESGKKQLKYHTNNPIYNYLVNGFNEVIKKNLIEISKFIDPKHILEIGVGEGQITQICLSVFPDAQYIAADIAKGILNVAKETLTEYHEQISFQVQDLHKIQYNDNCFDLVICCEVLEHIQEPEKGLSEIFRVLKPNGFAILSVPREPLWRMLNIARGYYWKRLGNTPGHINHWSTKGFEKIISNHKFEIIQINKPLPWSIMLVQNPVM